MSEARFAAAGPDPDPEPDPESVARTIALRLLEHAPRTRAELAAAMAKRNVPEEAAQVVLDRFTEVGLIDDAAYAQAWVDSRHHGRGLGRRALAAELRRKGIADELAAQALAEVSTDDEVAAAQVLVRRRLLVMRGVAPEVTSRRLVAMLGRKGFSAGLAYRVVSEELRDASAVSQS
ncbi:MAG TPA: regulatory protein RecX [Mycobacteriales bacterium]|nr:regulatory protein RecX [Mycobacteriales bacterium]